VPDAGRGRGRCQTYIREDPVRRTSGSMVLARAVLLSRQV